MIKLMLTNDKDDARLYEDKEKNNITPENVGYKRRMSLVSVIFFSFTKPNCSDMPPRLRSGCHPHLASYRDR